MFVRTTRLASWKSFVTCLASALENMAARIDEPQKPVGVLNFKFNNRWFVRGHPYKAVVSRNPQTAFFTRAPDFHFGHPSFGFLTASAINRIRPVALNLQPLRFRTFARALWFAGLCGCAALLFFHFNYY